MIIMVVFAVISAPKLGELFNHLNLRNLGLFSFAFILNIFYYHLIFSVFCDRIVRGEFETFLTERELPRTIIARQKQN